MTKQELFKKYSIDESHKEWSDVIDNWMSVEVYREMHDGKLPDGTDKSAKYITDFLDKCNDSKTGYGLKLMMSRSDFGSLYLTAKRMIYRFADIILSACEKCGGEIKRPTPMPCPTDGKMYCEKCITPN